MPGLGDSGEPITAQQMVAIAAAAGEYAMDPYGFALWNYPWGEVGTALAKFSGPDDWQCTVLMAIRDALKQPNRNEPVRIAIGAANGVGKSALGAMLSEWAMATQRNTRGTITANTATQLRTKTWAELSKWRTMAMTGPLFDLQATSLVSIDAKHGKTWRMDAVPWNEHKPEATAGTHNQASRLFFMTDEASSVPDIIWEYQDASTTDEDTEIIWLVLGNTTRNTGRFKECWGKFDERWIKPSGAGIRNGKVDGREARSTNKRLIEQWIKDYGEDSDFVRVRVRAEFPRVSDMQYFPSDWIYDARKREVSIAEVGNLPALIGVDVAGSGKNKTMITCRRGTKLLWQRGEPYTADTMKLVGKVLDIVVQERDVRSVAVDANGIGKGVADRLAELHALQPARVPPVVHVYGAHGSSDPVQFRNVRSELYDRMRSWLRQADIPYDSPLVEQMEAIEGGYTANMQTEVETKQSFMDRTHKDSPDELDSLAYTFAEQVYSQNIVATKARKRQLRQGKPL